MLTASSDNEVDGTAGPDTISANHLTIQNTDIIKGGAGTDTLTILNTGAALSIAPAILTDVENIQVTSSSGSTSTAVNLIAATGVEKVISKSSVVADTFSNLQTAAAIEIDGSSSDVTVSYKNSLLSGTADTLSLTVKGGADLGTVTLEGATASNVVETLNLVSSGASANAVNSIVSNSAAIGTIAVTGSASLTLGTGTAFGSGDVLINKLDASEFTGNLTAYVDENSGKAYSVIGGTGDDTIYLDGVDAFYNADNGNGTGNKVTSIVGGAGNDTLVVDASLIASQLVTTTADTADNVLSGVETLKLVASGTTGTVTIDASVSADITAVVTEVTNSTSSSGGATEITNAITNIKAQSISAKGTSGVDANDTVALSLKVYDGSAANTTLTATLAGTFNTVTAADASDDAATTATGADESGAVENVAITTGATNLTVASLAAASAFGVTLSGAKNVTISAADLGATNTSNTATTDDVVTINAADLAGNLDLTKSEAGVYAITAGTGTNAIRLGDVADNTTVTGGAGTDTIYVSDTGTSSVTVDITATGVETLIIDTITSGDDVFNMAAVAAGTTVKVVDAANAAGFGVSISNINGQNIDVVTANGTTDTSFASGAVIALAKATAATGVSVKLSGDAAGTAPASTYDGNIKTSGTLTVDSQIKTSAGAYLDTALELEGTSSSAKLTGLVLNGGGAYSSSANATVTVSNASNDNVALTSINASGFTGNINVEDSSIFDNGTSAATITLGGAGTLTVAAADLYRDLLSIAGGAGATTVAATGVGASGTSALRPAMTGVETLDLTLAQSSEAAATVDLRDVTGLTTVKLQVTANTTSATAYDEDITINDLANNATLVLSGNTAAYAATYGVANTSSSKGIAVAAAVSGAATLNVNNTGAVAAVTVAGSEGDNDGGLVLGSTYTALNVDLVAAHAVTFDQISGSGLTSVALENNQNTGTARTLTVSGINAAALTTLTIDSTEGAVTVSDLNTMNSLETLTVNTGVAAGGGTATITAGTSTSIDTITASGTGAFTITALTAASLDSINASGVTGVVTLGNTTTAALTTAAGASITTGTADDIVSVNTSTLGTISMGSKADADGVPSDDDTLYLIGAQGSGTGVIDLSQAGDQILTINGQSNTTVQSGIESVNVASMTSTNSYGWTITAAAEGSTITGSGYNDVINGGAAADALNGGSGADTITTNGGGDTVTGGAGVDSIVLGSGVDTVILSSITAAANRDVVDGFTIGTDKITTNITGTASSKYGTEITALSSNAITVVKGKITEIAQTATTMDYADTDLSAYTDGTGVIAALLEANGGSTAGTITQAAASDAQGYLVMYSGGDAYLYYYSNTSTDGIVAGEIALVGVFNDITANAITAASFGLTS